MYNRTDGFDTFAHSAGLNRELIERELSVAYLNKLNKGDLAAVRKGEISPVYSQCTLRTGEVVQSCTTYLPLDYTGERSSYLTHSLIFEGEEKDRLLSNSGSLCFNPDLFVKDIGAFDLTGTTATPDQSYPTLEHTAQAGDPSELVGKYTESTIKAFIYAVLSTVKGKGRSVYFRLPYPDAELSRAALDFLNRIIAVIPYGMRDSVSFVSYVTDYTQYPTYRIKCASERCGEMSGTRNAMIDLQTGMISGIDENEFSSNRAVMTFFYMLLESKETREEFLAYMQNAARVNPALESPTLKVLSDLVFLFCVVSGHFSESVVLPNDASVYELFCVYEKYRDILAEEYRREAYRCLNRYPTAHQAIPKNIFQKLTKLYTKECRSARRVAMNAVLELIHTDIMRDKLFSFIRSNYASESDDVKAIVNADLCRVFYGGFLQPQILEFFSVNFTNTPEQTRDLIIEKVLLTVRTPSIQQKVLSFISTHYDDMSEAQRARVYDTFFEMLPECDALAASLCEIVDRHIPLESDEIQKSVSERIATALEANYRKKEHLMMPILASGEGFCREQVIKLALGAWSTRKIYAEYIALLGGKKIAKKTEEIAFILGYDGISREAKDRLIGELEGLYSENTQRTTLYAWLDVDVVFAECVDASDLKNIREKVLYPAIKGKLFDVFNVERGKEGMARAESYCKQSGVLTDSDGYKAISLFGRLSAAISDGAADRALSELHKLTSLGIQPSHLSAYIKAFACDSAADINIRALCELCASIALGELHLARLYSVCKQNYTQQYLIEHGAKADPIAANTDGARRSAILLWGYILQIDALGETGRELLVNAKGDFGAMLDSFNADHGKGADKWLEQNMQSRPEALADCFANARVKAKKENGGFFSRIFGKK